jgi:hypothetical protein
MPQSVPLFRNCNEAAKFNASRGQFDQPVDFTPHGPCTPTDAPPGSPAKIKVLQLRLQQGLELWNAADPTDFRDGQNDLGRMINQICGRNAGPKVVDGGPVPTFPNNAANIRSRRYRAERKVRTFKA